MKILKKLSAVFLTFALVFSLAAIGVSARSESTRLNSSHAT